jgi:hypothetical protein
VRRERVSHAGPRARTAEGEVSALRQAEAERKGKGASAVRPGGVAGRVIRVGPVVIEQVTDGLLRVSGGGDQLGVVEALRRASGEPDDRRGRPKIWWIPAKRLPRLRRKLRRATDPLFRRVGLDLDAWSAMDKSG